MGIHVNLKYSASSYLNGALSLQPSKVKANINVCVFDFSLNRSFN